LALRECGVLYETTNLPKSHFYCKINPLT
jgi:hypothetical protein